MRRLEPSQARIRADSRFLEDAGGAGRVGVDPEEDASRGFVVQDGLTIAGKDQPYD